MKNNLTVIKQLLSGEISSLEVTEALRSANPPFIVFKELDRTYSIGEAGNFRLTEMEKGLTEVEMLERTKYAHVIMIEWKRVC